MKRLAITFFMFMSGIMIYISALEVQAEDIQCMGRSEAEYGVAQEDYESLEEQVYQINLNMYNAEATDEETLQNCLRQEVSDKIKAKACEVTSACLTDMDKVQVIHDWVANNIYYDLYGLMRNDEDIICTATEVFENRKYAGTVCEGYANLTAAMCNAAGVPCKVVRGYALGLGTAGYWTQDLVDYRSAVNHAWNEVYVNGRWVIMDVTWDSQYSNTADDKTPVFQKCKQTYFDAELREFSKTHKIMEQEYSNVDGTVNRKIDPDLQLNVTVDDNNIYFDWNELDYGIGYELQYNVIDGDVFGKAYSTGMTFECSKMQMAVPHYEEPVALYGSCWPMYFRICMYKKDGTIWYSETLEYAPSTSVNTGGNENSQTENATTDTGNSNSVTDSTVQSEPGADIHENTTKRQPDRDISYIIAKPQRVSGLSAKNKKTGKLILKWGSRKEAIGYQIQVAAKKSFRGARNRTSYGNKLTWGGLKKGKVYYIRVRAYNKDSYGYKQYGAWSAVKRIKVKK